MASVGGATVAAAQVGEFPSYHWGRVVRAGRDVFVLDAHSAGAGATGNQW